MYRQLKEKESHDPKSDKILAWKRESGHRVPLQAEELLAFAAGRKPVFFNEVTPGILGRPNAQLATQYNLGSMGFFKLKNSKEQRKRT